MYDKKSWNTAFWLLMIYFLNFRMETSGGNVEKWIPVEK